VDRVANVATSESERIAWHANRLRLRADERVKLTQQVPGLRSQFIKAATQDIASDAVGDRNIVTLDVDVGEAGVL